MESLLSNQEYKTRQKLALPFSLYEKGCAKKNNLNRLTNERINYYGKREAKWQSLQDELLKALVINKCWQRINDLLDDPKADQKFLNLLASEIAKITISQDIKEKGSFY